MRPTKLISWLLLCGTLAFFAVSARAQTERPPGRIVAAKVAGTVTVANRGASLQEAVALRQGDTVAQDTTVRTGPNSSVILVFENGSSLNLGGDSTMDIEEFLMEPWANPGPIGELEAEPTTSTTRVHLTRGELVGNVKKLNREAGSEFRVGTPVGAAGIRGTTFRIVFRPDSSGRVFFTLSTAEGVVLFEAPAAAGVSVETGNEVAVSVDVTVDEATGVVTLNSTPTVEGLTQASTETLAAIQVAAVEIVEASETLIVSSTAGSSGDTSGAEGEQQEQQEQEEQETEQQPATGENDDSQQGPTDVGNPNFGPTTAPIRTTGGDGKTF